MAYRHNNRDLEKRSVVRGLAKEQVNDVIYNLVCSLTGLTLERDEELIEKAKAIVFDWLKDNGINL